MPLSPKQKEWFKRNRLRLLEYKKQWTKENRYRHLSNCRKWAENNKEKSRDIKRRSADKNRERMRAKKNARIKNDPAFRMRHYLGCRLRLALKENFKSGGTVALLGCSVDELRKHLESKFRIGMTWENYGPVWHVDHIKPCELFDLSSPSQQKICFHYSNLQPLFAIENWVKGSKYAS